MDVLQIPDDVWFLTFCCLTPLEFVSIVQTCTHFNKLNDPTKYPAVNKCWEHHCHRLWSLCKPNNYPATLTSNFLDLFESMIYFILSTVTGPQCLDFTEINNLPNNYTAFTILDDPESKYQLMRKLLKPLYNMEITVDRISHLSKKTHFVAMIIAQDNDEMFKIYIHNQQQININQKTDNSDNSDHDHDNFDINSPIPFLSTGSGNRGTVILFQVIQDGAVKIANYLLGRTKVDHDHDLTGDEKKSDFTNDDNDDNGDKGSKIKGGDSIEKKDEYMYTYSYNFPNIDVIGSKKRLYGDTFLTLATFHQEPDIVSLLINHPNMTKSGINQVANSGWTALHHALNHETEDPDITIEIATMLINDERTDINAVDNEGNSVLMYATEYQPKIVPILVLNKKFNVNIQNLDGQTALHWIIERKWENGFKIELESRAIGLAKLLLKRKDFDLNIKDKKNRTAVDLAKHLAFHTMFDLLSANLNKQ